MTGVMWPLVHLNGTSRDELARQLGEAVVALEEAGVKMQAAAPHARDYYPLGKEAWEQAVEEHNSRVVRVSQVMGELVEILDKVLG